MACRKNEVQGCIAYYLTGKFPQYFSQDQQSYNIWFQILIKRKFSMPDF